MVEGPFVKGVPFASITTAPTPRLLEPGTYRAAGMVWGQPLWAASYLTAVENSPGVPDFLKASVGMPIRTAYGKGFSNSIRGADFANQHMINLRLGVEQDGRMFYASGRTAVRQNYMDWLGLFHRLDREAGYNPVLGQPGQLSSYNFKGKSFVQAITSSDVAEIAAMQAKGRIPALGAKLGGRLWAGTTILRQMAGEAGFAASGGIGAVGGSWLEKTFASGALSSVESLGRSMITASEDILWDWSRGVKVPTSSLELAHTISGLTRNFGGTYKERLAFIQNYAKASVADRSGIAADWNRKFGVKAEAIFGEWENNLYSHDAKFGKGVSAPMDVLRRLTGGVGGVGGFVHQAYGKSLEDMLIAQGIQRGTPEFLTQMRELELTAAKMHMRHLSVSKTLSTAVGATMLDYGVTDLLEKQDQGGLIGKLLHTTRRMLTADLGHLEPGQTANQLRAQMLERSLADLAGGKANLLTFLTKRSGASLSLETFAPGVRGDVGKTGVMEAQGFLSISGKTLAKHLNLIPGAEARMNWGRFESQRVVVPLGMVYDRKTLKKALFQRSGKLSPQEQEAILNEWMGWGVGNPHKPITMTSPAPGLEPFYFIRGKTTDGKYAGPGQVGGPLNLVQALAGHDEGPQVEATRAILMRTQQDMELLGYKVYSDSSSSAETRSRGQVRLTPDNPHGIASVAKNTGRHFQGALYPGKNRVLARRSPRMSFMAGDQAAFEETSRGTLTMRVAEMRGGIVSEDAAIVSRWAVEGLVGVEAPRNFRPSGQGKFMLSPTVEAAALLGKTAGRHVEYAVGADGVQRLQVALGYYIRPENEQAYHQIVGKAAGLSQQIAEIYGSRREGWGKELKDLAASHNVKVREWMLGMIERRDAFSAQSMVQTELTTQMVQHAGIGNAIFERVAANQRLFYAGQNVHGIHTTIAQSHGMTKFTTLFGGNKALAHTVMNEMIYALPTGQDLNEAVFRPVAKSAWTTPFQFDQAVKATHRTRGLMRQMIARGELGREWELPEGWAGKAHLGTKETSTIESWVSRGWRGKQFSSTPHYWHQVMGDLGLREAEGAQDLMRGFGKRYFESYTGGIESRIRGAFGEATSELDANALRRGWARLAYGMGASGKDAVALAQGLTDVASVGNIGKTISLSQVKAADRSMREYTALFAASGVGGSFGTQASNLNPYNAVDRLKIQTLSVQRMQQMLGHEQELGWAGKLENSRLLRWAVVFSSKYKLVESLLHLKPGADSTSIDRFLYEPLITLMNDRGVGRTLRNDPNLHRRVNADLKSRIGGEMFVGRDGKASKWDVSVNFFETDRPGEVTLARGLAFKETLIRHGLLPEQVADSLSHTLVGPTKYTLPGKGAAELGGHRVAASKDFALSIHDAAKVMTDTLDYGMGTKEWSDLNRKDVAIHLRGFAEVARRLTGGKLTERQTFDFSSWYLLQHMRPNDNVETMRIFGAGMLDFKKAGEAVGAFGRGKGMLDVFSRVAKAVPGKTAGQPTLNAEDLIARIESGLSGGLMGASDEQVGAFLTSTYGKELPRGFRLNLSAYGGLEQERAFGGRILDQFMERVKGRYKGDPTRLDHAFLLMENFLAGPDAVRLHEAEIRPTLGGGSETALILKDVAKITGKYSNKLPLSKSTVFVSPQASENSIFRPVTDGAEEVAAPAMRHLTGLLRGLAHPGHSVLGNDDLVEGFIDSLSSMTQGPGDQFYEAQLKNAYSPVQNLIGRGMSKTARHIESLTEMQVKPVVDAMRGSIGKVRSQRAYIAPLVTRDKFLGLLEQAREAGYSDINMIVGGNSALVSDSSVLLGFDHASKAVNVMMGEENAKVIRALITAGRQPSIYNWSYYNAAGKYHAAFPFGVMGAESSLTAQLHVGDNDSDTMASLLFKDPAKLLRRWLGQEGIEGVDVAPLTKDALAAERAVTMRKGRAMNQMLTDGILASIFERDGDAIAGQTNLEWARNIATASLESLGVEGADREASKGIFRIVSPMIRAWGAHHLATADAAKAELQKNLTGVADSLLMALPGALDTIHGRLLDAEANPAMRSGLELFERHFGADKGSLLEAARIFQQTSAADYSQAFIGGKHGYTSFSGNLLPVMALSTADPEALGMLNGKPELMDNAVRGLLDPGQYSNFRSFLQKEVAAPFAREDVGQAFDKAFGVIARTDTDAAAKGINLLTAIRKAAQDPAFDDDLLVRSVKGLHSVMMDKGQLGALADVVTPLAYGESYEKEKKLLEPLKLKDGKIRLSGHWAEAAKMTADQLGMETGELEDRWVKGSIGYIRDVVGGLEGRARFPGAGHDWWKQVLGSEQIRSRIKSDDIYAAKAGMQLIGAHAAAVVGETDQFEFDFTTPAKGAVHRRNRQAISSALPSADGMPTHDAARTADRNQLVGEMTAAMDWEGLIPAEDNPHPTASGYMGRINKAMFTADQVEDELDLEDFEERQRRQFAERQHEAPSAPTAHNNILAEEGSRVIGAPETGVSRASAANITTQATAAATRAEEGVSTQMLSQSGRAGEQGAERTTSRGVSGLLHNPVILGGAALGAVMLAGMMGGGNQPLASDPGLPKFNKETLDDYQAVVDEVLPNPSPVKVTPYRNTYGMNSDQRMRMNGVDDGTLNTLSRVFAPGDNRTKVVVRDQSRSHKRWMLRREVDEYMASAY